MAISPLVSKGLVVGLGGVSVVGIGGLAVKQGYFSKENKSTEGTTGESPGNPAPAKNESYLEKLGLPATCDLTSNACTLKKEDLNKLKFIFDSKKKGKPNIGTEVEADLAWEKTGEDKSIDEFTFTIKAKAGDIDLGDSLSNIKIPSTESWMKFKLKEETASGDQKEYYLQLEHSSKESSANLKCESGNSCSKLDSATNINGLNNSPTVTKENTTETTRYPNDYKYKVVHSPENEADGYYKLEFDDASKKWKLTKVDDLLSKWDESVLTTGKWEIPAGLANNIIVVVSETNKEINSNKQWAWQCEIKAKPGSSTSNLTDQTNYLKTQLGIGQTKETQEIKDQRRKFVENCARNRENTDKEKAKKESFDDETSSLRSSITLTAEDDKFKEEDFKKIFTGKVVNAGS